MKTLREEFELMCINNLLNIAKDDYGVYFDDFANGAWYAYQEQHKKIVAYQKMIEMERCLNKANILSSGAFHHGENVIHVGTIDNPNQTLTINVDENGNIETSNHNGDDK